MNIIIAMAGEGSRFLKEGYERPKYELLANGKPLFDWALTSLEHFFKSETFTFVCKSGSEAFIKERCHELGIEQFDITSLNSTTRGQAETVIKALSDKDEEILIYNIDTYIDPKSSCLGSVDWSVNGWLLLFEAPGDHWSFAKLGEDGNVVEVSEKVRISDHASVGLYYFKSSEEFRDIFNKHCDDIISQYKEVYIAPMYKYIIEKPNSVVGQKTIEFDQVIPLGTPEEVKRFDSSF